MNASAQTMSIRQRVLAVLNGKKPDRLPFIGRMDFWYRGRCRQGTLPCEYQGLSLPEIHQAIGFGHEDWQCPYLIKYRGVELKLDFEGETLYHEIDPEIANFPTLWGMIPVDRAGTTSTELITPLGRLTFQHRMLEESVVSGTTRPQMVSRPIRDDADYRIYEYVIEHAEYIPRHDRFLEQEAEVGEGGYLVPIIERIPFQHLLLDAVGEVEFFYALYDRPKLIDRLLKALDLQVTEKLKRLSSLPVPYVEFVDNLDGFMTNPKLFAEYVLPEYQSYSDIVHGQGKKLGSHTDGDLKPLLHLLPECGLDVCESFTPAPITGCGFEEAWEAWSGGPLIWGGLPSYYLEERVSEREFLSHVERLLQTVGDRPIILGIGDAVMSNNLIDRVRQVARMVEKHRL